MGFTSAVLVNDEDSKVGKRNDFNWHLSASWLNLEALSGKCEQQGNYEIW